MWNMVPMSLFWCLWKERNNTDFEDMERTLGEILYLFYKTFFFISNVYIKDARGATLVHKKYTRRCLRQKRKENKKIRKANF